MADEETDVEQRRREYRRERQRRYREKNREKIAASEAAWRARNPDYHRQWRARNPDYHRQWRARNRERVNARQREWRARRPLDVRQASHRKHWADEWALKLERKYGLTLEQYEALLSEQSGKCAICSREGNVGGKRLAVDHCHETGAVRGLLCNPCNTMLGRAGDDVDLLTAAVTYLLARRDVLKGGPP